MRHGGFDSTLRSGRRIPRSTGPCAPPDNTLSGLLAPISLKNEIGKILSRFFNETRGIRTPDNLIKSQVLYQLS